MAAINVASFTDEDFLQFCNSFDTILTDCDGVLWIQMTPLPQSSEVINTFCSTGKTVYYVTNNSTKTRDEYVQKCKLLNFQATKDNILCTANLSANYLKDIGFQKKVYIIGPKAVAKELEEVGISHCGVTPDVVNPDLPNSYMNFEKDPEVGAVIVGFDEHFSYPKMVKAATYLSDEKVHFIGTNTDERFPTPNKVVAPGTGCLVRCIENCAERKAVIMGKPETYLADFLIKRYKINPERTLMIGDRCNTDILLGTRCGFKTLLVLTGVTSLQDVNKWKESNNPAEKELIPDYYIEKLGDLLPFLQKLPKN